MSNSKKKKVVVIGGGIAGVETAIHLDKKIFDVHLISERTALYIYPLAIWVPVGKKSVSDISMPLENLAKKHKFQFHHEKVSALQIERKQVATQDNKVFSYDYLVLAHGSAKWKVSGVENISTICGTPQMAASLREQYKKLLAQKKGRIAVGFGGNPKDPSAVRGGPAFELLFNIDRDLRKKGLRKNFTLTFFAPMAQPGKRMGKGALSKVGKFIEKAGIEMIVGKKILGFEGQNIKLESKRIDSDLTVFVSALEGSELNKTSQLPMNEAGFFKAHTTGQIEGQEFIFGAGDTIDFHGPQWKAKQGHMAEVQANTVAKNIKAHALDKPLKYNFEDKVSIICLMDFGSTGAFIFRGKEREFSVYLYRLGHFLKWGWGIYFKAVKNKLFFKIPGL